MTSDKRISIGQKGMEITTAEKRSPTPIAKPPLEALQEAATRIPTPVARPIEEQKAERQQSKQTKTHGKKKAAKHRRER
jgi:hypothetical protein